MTKVCCLGILGLATVLAAPVFAAGPTCGNPPVSDKTKWAMYFDSKPRDHAGCAMSVESGRIVVAPGVTNPAMTCPDMVSWQLFVQAVNDGFWKSWAADSFTWPQVHPYPLCKSGQDPRKNKCCVPGSADNPGYNDPDNPASFCPYFPGDHLKEHPDGMLLKGLPPSKAHGLSFAALPETHTRLLALQDEPGRKIRQAVAELVFRNKPMFDFTFENDLYNQEGIISVFNRNGANLKNGAPYRGRNDPGGLVEIDFPVAAVMIKSEWVNQKRAADLGLKWDPEHPYVRMSLLTPVTDNNGTIFEAGEHWLVAIHISSKDTPNWVWTTFEHVNNPGRCDFTGCNDSYGYRSPDQIGPGQAANFTTPKLKCDDLLLPSFVFDPGKVYADGKINGELEKVFRDAGIGTRNNTSLHPTPQDRAWLSYRLKGSQVDFTDAIGRPTRLGNSVTEGGFMNTSSCVGCHARAGTTATGTIPLALGVFVNELSEAGYQQSHMGVPNPDWFHASNQPPALTVLQTDFVWGFLAAQCVSCDSAVCPSAARPADCSSSKALAAPTLRQRSVRELIDLGASGKP